MEVFCVFTNPFSDELIFDLHFEELRVSLRLIP
jgi:hypothetical protein